MEPIYRQQFEISTIHLDCTGRMKPSMALYFAQEVAGQHCAFLGTDWDSMAKKGLFWAVIRSRVRFTRLPRDGETVFVETWPMPTTRVAYPRTVAAFDAGGKPLFEVQSLWVLMDMDSRTMVMPAKSGVEVQGILRGTEMPVPASIPQAMTDNRASRRVGFSDLDRNGHMNNVRYLDWVADLLPRAFHGRSTPSEMELVYFAESREDEILDLGWSLDEAGILHAEITRTATEDSKPHRIFAAKIRYGGDIMETKSC